MSDSFRINTLLYATALKKHLTCCPGITIGMTSGTAKSKHRTASNNADAKISMIAMAFDQFVSETSTPYAFVELDAGAVYMERSEFKGILSSDMILSTNRRPEPADIVALLFVHTLVSRKNEEFNHICSELFELYNAFSVVSDDQMIALLCDSYYYGTLKKENNPYIHSNIVDESTLLACVRSSNPREIPELKGTNTVKPGFAFRKAKKKKNVEETDLRIFINDCKAGKFLVDFSWEDSQTEYVQSLQQLDGYIPNYEFRSILKKIKYRTDKVLKRLPDLDLTKGEDRITAIGNDYINLTLSGKPGTGKTKLAYMLAAATGLPIYTVSNSHNTDEDEYEGKTKMIDGRAVSVETDTLKCVEKGERISN